MPSEIPYNFTGKKAVTGRQQVCSQETWHQTLARPPVSVTEPCTRVSGPPGGKRSCSCHGEAAMGPGLFSALSTSEHVCAGSSTCECSYFKTICKCGLHVGLLKLFRVSGAHPDTWSAAVFSPKLCSPRNPELGELCLL